VALEVRRRRSRHRRDVWRGPGVLRVGRRWASRAAPCTTPWGRHQPITRNHTASASADISASAIVCTIERRRSGLAWVSCSSPSRHVDTGSCGHRV